MRRGKATSHFHRHFWPGRASRRQARRADDEVVHVAREVIHMRANSKRGLPSRRAVVPGVGHLPPNLSIHDEAHNPPASLEAEPEPLPMRRFESGCSPLAGVSVDLNLAIVKCGLDARSGGGVVPDREQPLDAAKTSSQGTCEQAQCAVQSKRSFGIRHMRGRCVAQASGIRSVHA